MSEKDSVSARQPEPLVCPVRASLAPILVPGNVQLRSLVPALDSAVQSCLVAQHGHRIGKTVIFPNGEPGVDDRWDEILSGGHTLSNRFLCARLAAMAEAKIQPVPCVFLASMRSFHRPQSGHIMCYLNRTYHVLPTQLKIELAGA